MRQSFGETKKGPSITEGPDYLKRISVITTYRNISV